MSTFTSLLKYRRGKPPGDAQKKAQQDFPRKVAQSRLKLRKAGEPLPVSGRLFIIGIASYAPAELKLLDQLEDVLSRAAPKMIDVEVFDVLSCKEKGDFGGFIPGINGVYRTPILGVISNGTLIDQATGLSDVVTTLYRFDVLNHS